MRIRVLLAICALSLLLVPAWAQGQDDEKNKTVELLGGVVYNFKTPLRIEQDGQSDLDFDAKYRTRPFESPQYYVLRFAKWNGDKGKEIELIHDKLFLDNKPAEVQKFDISHGFNMLMMNEAWKRNGLIYHFGAGPVITHPENTVRNLDFEHGYYLSGAAIQFAVGKQFKLSGNLFGTLEAKVTGAYARVRVEDGHANVSNLAVHGVFGIGYRF
jgi:hypothetical protein